MSNLDVKPFDRLGRTLADLRISVTDRCNFRCTYCMPKEIFNRDYKFLERTALLSFEEITRLARVFVSLGARKVRLTGGEPLLRAGLEQLVGMLAEVSGVADLTLTTNGVLLPRKAQALADAGLDRVTVSLDSLSDEVFSTMNDVGAKVADVLAGIDAAADAGLTPIKVNMVVRRGVNDHSILEMAEHFRGSGHILRFIEYMDVGVTNGWRLDDVTPAHEIISTVNDVFPIEPLDPNYRGEVAKRWRYADGQGELGVIASVTQPFCGDCTRARLSADGKLYTCLFAVFGTDLREAVRSGASDEDLRRRIGAVWSERVDQYSELRSGETAGIGQKVEMSYIGG
ncbi:MAG: GTP 3',8-cyclase MoaA [Acidimicrobiia bacterium]|nr:GTP 3',8-cyclase MoaA [Acidimicrobiia bacterium]MYA39439.1 GTP 3',8-cyclase MoaA [Acidimicrobiia bacterium]MYH06086.1 GTP 3',8-cyclase MoaA [Acidimicrobiia bacterium]MYJ15056.1 GTP 3',8-cyclase MoaA [Acidimicrobiia bacterium]MYK55451.1 GTP 3',8-cyclase MoaA [Acidimicrobiia bacterium]